MKQLAQIDMRRRPETSTVSDRIDSGPLHVLETLCGRLQRLRDASAATLREHLGLNQVYLLPLRLFIGLGWLRACAEKIGDPDWYRGVALTTFLEEQMAHGSVAFPFYDALIANAFLPNASGLSWLIIVGQLLVGLAILTGTFTNAALLGGLFMNANFLLAGEPNPSAFYIVLQVALLLSGAGYVFGADARLSRTIRSSLVCAQPVATVQRWSNRRTMAVGTLASLAAAIYSVAHVSNFSPDGSVGDPALIAAIISMLASLWFAISYLRLRILDPVGASPVLHPEMPAATITDLATPQPVEPPRFRRIA